MTKKIITTVLVIFVVAFATMWLLDILRDRPVDWVLGFVVTVAGTIGALAGLYWREKRAR